MHEEVQSIKNQALAQIMEAKTSDELEAIRIYYLGRHGRLSLIIKDLKKVSAHERRSLGALINDVKRGIEREISERKNSITNVTHERFDQSIPGIKPKIGHLHLITQAIAEIADVFEKIGFVRARYPEVEWDWYSFTSLNFPEGHPAWDTLETYFVDAKANKEMGKMVLSPHTSSGQVREMERTRPPIRMVNIAKCYRRQSDISHTPMFHQFEGLVIDKDISIVNLKGTLDYFAQNFFGKERKTRLRPYHFQFTEPSFEVDISCDLCHGSGKINGAKCRLCKAGWLELGGAGMVHPNVLTAGKVDPEIYSGFAFGWGVERTFMMKSGLSIPDLRMLYSADLQFLTQF